MKWALVLLWLNVYTGDIDISKVHVYDTHDQCWADLIVYYDNLHAYYSDCVQAEE